MSGIHVVQPLPRVPTFINTSEFILSRNPVSLIKDIEPSARNYPFLTTRKVMWRETLTL